MVQADNIQNIKIAYAMRYGNPSISLVIQQFMEINIDKVFILPLYPQYASSTTGSAFESVFSELIKYIYIPEIISFPAFYNHKAYIKTMATHITAYWNKHGQGDKLLFSFHGLPDSSIKAGDPYFTQCQHSAYLLAEALNLNKSQWHLSFQSRFGKQKWLQPYTTDILQQLGKQQIKLDVICPGFISDCLETLEEIACTGKEQFFLAGGKKFNYIPCLNDSFPCINMLYKMIKNHI